jgi:hypothetical protein
VGHLERAAEAAAAEPAEQLLGAVGGDRQADHQPENQESKIC